MSFTIESESETKCPFLMCRLFTTSVYCKPTFSEVYTHLDNFLPSAYKFHTVHTLAYRCLQMSSSWTKLHNELVCLK